MQRSSNTYVPQPCPQLLTPSMHTVRVLQSSLMVGVGGKRSIGEIVVGEVTTGDLGVMTDASIGSEAIGGLGVTMDGVGEPP